jgi:hypothetical protein
MQKLYLLLEGVEGELLLLLIGREYFRRALKKTLREDKGKEHFIRWGITTMDVLNSILQNDLITHLFFGNSSSSELLLDPTVPVGSHVYVVG